MSNTSSQEQMILGKSSSLNRAAFSGLKLYYYSNQELVESSISSDSELSNSVTTDLNSLKNSKPRPKFVIGIDCLTAALVPSSLFDDENPGIYLEGQLSSVKPNMVTLYSSIPSLHATLVYGVDAHVLDKVNHVFENSQVYTPILGLLSHWQVLAKKSKNEGLLTIYVHGGLAHLSYWRDSRLNAFTIQDVSTIEDTAYFAFNLLEQYGFDGSNQTILVHSDSNQKELFGLVSKYHNNVIEDSIALSIPSVSFESEEAKSDLHIHALLLCA